MELMNHQCVCRFQLTEYNERIHFVMEISSPLAVPTTFFIRANPVQRILVMVQIEKDGLPSFPLAWLQTNSLWSPSVQYSIKLTILLSLKFHVAKRVLGMWNLGHHYILNNFYPWLHHWKRFLAYAHYCFHFTLYCEDEVFFMSRGMIRLNKTLINLTRLSSHV